MTLAARNLPAVAPGGGMVHVTVMPHFDPGEGRILFDLGHGVTIEEIIRVWAPLAEEGVLARFRVVLVSATGCCAVDRALWRIVRPHAGVHVVIRVTPAGPAIGPIIQLVVSVAAKAIGGSIGTALGLGKLATSILTFGLTVAGGLLVNYLFRPKQQGSEREEKPNYALAGLRNEMQPDAPFPLVLGKIRHAPRFAAPTWTEVVGNDIYIRCKFLWGYGPLNITDLKIGDTLIDEYDEVEVETQYGRDDDDPLTLYTDQVIEESVGAELTNRKPLDDYGEELDEEPAEAKPVVRYTAADASGACVIFYFPSGLFNTNDEGNTDPKTVQIKIEQKLVGAVGAPDLVAELEIDDKEHQPFFRAHRWAFDTRGRYEITVTRTDEEDGNIEDPDTIQWFALQSIRPEYPLNFDKPLALTDVRIKATAQLNGTLDTFNGVVSSEIANFDATDWDAVEETQNPAALVVHVLRGNHWARPQADGDLDWAFFEDWHDFCVAKGLKYHRVIDFDASLEDLLREVGAAGRAAIWHDGEKWTGFVDKVRDVVTDHVNPRNSSGFRWGAAYFERPDAYKVSFLDETNEYQSAERVVPWPADVRYATKAELDADLAHPEDRIGEVYDDPTPANNTYYRKVGAAGAGSWAVKSFDVVETVELPGKTDPDEIWIEARRLQYERIHRNVWYEATQPGSARVVAPGDLVLLSRDVLVRRAHSGRVMAIKGSRIVLDEFVTMEEGGTYAIRFRVYSSDSDAMGTSVQRSVKTVAGRHKALTLTGAGDVPEIDALVHFGPSTQESIEAIIAGIGRGNDNASILQMLPAANVIHTLTDAETPPTWSGRVGAPLEGSSTPPAVPVVTGVGSGLAGTENADWIEINLRPGSGSVLVASFEVQHREQGEVTWSVTPASGPASGGMVRMTSYSSGDIVEWQPRAVSIHDVPSDWGATRTTTIGVDDPAIPDALDDDLIEVVGLLGHATISILVPSSADNTTHFQVHHNTTGVEPDVDEDELWSPIAVDPGASVARVHGDSTIDDQAVNGDMASATGWTVPADFSIAAGVAHKAAGAATRHLYQACSPSGLSAKLRWQLTVLNWVAGSFLMRISTNTGSLIQQSAAMPAANGTYFGTLQNGGAGAARIGPVAVNTVVGDCDDFIYFEETADCLTQGTHHYWFRPFNGATPGPLSGPFTVTVI